jgi:hypothetical protein
MILRLDPDSLEVISQKVIPDTSIVSLRRSDKVIYAAATARPDRSESGFPRHAGGASLTH